MSLAFGVLPLLVVLALVLLLVFPRQVARSIVLVIVTFATGFVVALVALGVLR